MHPQRSLAEKRQPAPRWRGTALPALRRCPGRRSARQASSAPPRPAAPRRRTLGLAPSPLRGCRASAPSTAPPQQAALTRQRTARSVSRGAGAGGRTHRPRLCRLYPAVPKTPVSICAACTQRFARSQRRQRATAAVGRRLEGGREEGLGRGGGARPAPRRRAAPPEARPSSSAPAPLSRLSPLSFTRGPPPGAGGHCTCTSRVATRRCPHGAHPSCSSNSRASTTLSAWPAPPGKRGPLLLLRTWTRSSPTPRLAPATLRFACTAPRRCSPRCQSADEAIHSASAATSCSTRPSSAQTLAGGTSCRSTCATNRAHAPQRSGTAQADAAAAAAPDAETRALPHGHFLHPVAGQVHLPIRAHPL